MYCITDAQIDWMLNDFRTRGITLDSLQQDLLDHVCCIIEQSLAENGDFERCYQTTIVTFYKEQLAEIETETLLLQTFKHYYAMKKTMIISGALSVTAFITGSWFKLMHWPGASVLLLLGIVSFCFLFLPLMLVLKIREQGAVQDKLVISLAVLLCITFFMSSLFKVQHWPGANVLWYLTLAGTFLVFIPAYFFTGIRKPERRFNTIITTILLVAFTGIEFTMTALRRPQEIKSQPTEQQISPTTTAR